MKGFALLVWQNAQEKKSALRSEAGLVSFGFMGVKVAFPDAFGKDESKSSRRGRGDGETQVRQRPGIPVPQAAHFPSGVIRTGPT